VTASSCAVCPENPVPLWSIRARRVIHDQEARQIYFEGAQFRLFDVPIAYIPRLRFPDPTIDRAPGFLFPRLRTSSLLGTGLKLPYFLPLGRSADITLTPYLSSATATLEFGYRQAFRTGDLSFRGAITRDDIIQGETRGYLFGDAAFTLPKNYRLAFHLETATDEAYLLDYGYGTTDRLVSSAAIERTRRDIDFSARIISFRSLREDEDVSTLPSPMTELSYTRRYDIWGGIGTLEGDFLTLYRPSEADILGRDVSRARLAFGWERTETFGPGLLATFSAQLSAESYGIENDTGFPAHVEQVLPEAAVTLRWPLAKTGSGGVRHVLEPAAMLAWSPENPETLPNEESGVAEFDEVNLLSFSRFPGTDARETGLRLALGFDYSRFSPTGGRLSLSFGRIYWGEASPYDEGTGLEGESSDWLFGLGYEWPNRLDLKARTLLDDGFGVSKADIRLGYGGARFDIETGFLYLAAAPSENRPDDVAEWTFDANWRIDANWSGRADWRYDFDEGRASRAGIGFGFENECVRVDLSLSRRFTSSTSLKPTTDFGLSVELLGFGTGGEGGAPRRRCVTY
jgi:LPS-assembly protein